MKTMNKRITYSIELDRDLHKKLKFIAFENETTMRTFVIKTLKDAVDKSDNKGNAK